MLRLIGIVISIGLADSLNPTTIGPALYVATGERARERVAEFTLAVFAVYFLGGAAITKSVQRSPIVVSASARASFITPASLLILPRS